MAKILVTGGAGFIGSHIVDVYCAAGHDVVVVDSLSTGNAANVNPNAQLIEMDIRDAGLTDVFEMHKPEIVNHLAAQMDVRVSMQYPLSDADINILGGLRVLELCHQHKVRKFIFASTGGAIYGDPENLPATEKTAPRPKSPYGVSKLCLEHYIRLYRQLYGLRFSILRFPNVYGPRQNPNGEAGVCAIFIGQLLRGEVPILLGDGLPVRDYVYVTDIAKANLLALDKGDGRTINLGSNTPTTVREIYEHIVSALNSDVQPDAGPLRKGEVEKIFLSCDRAKEELGWEPETTLEEGIRLMAEHIKGAWSAPA